MCRNIKTLFNVELPASKQVICAAALQFVRKVNNSNQPGQVNQAACDKATGEISNIVPELRDSLATRATPKDRDREAAGARAKKGSKAIRPYRSVVNLKGDAEVCCHGRRYWPRTVKTQKQ